ncbi:MAG: hypothetical protein MJ091_05465 [Clostridia bacterium]|nr:hypothetical protein [Clostridia bacterium]
MNFRYKLMQFMSGRNGLDRLFYLLFAVAAVIWLVNCFVRSIILQLIIDAILIYAFFRVLSKNVYARRKEETAVFSLVDKFMSKINTKKQQMADKTHIYKKCPYCKATLRLPRRKGKHKTVCPKCNKEFTVRVFKEYKY